MQPLPDHAFECRDKIDRNLQTGRTPYECRRSCYLHCGTNLRKASQPTGLGVVLGASTGSSVAIDWIAPADTGGRCENKIKNIFSHRNCEQCTFDCGWALFSHVQDFGRANENLLFSYLLLMTSYFWQSHFVLFHLIHPKRRAGASRAHVRSVSEIFVW